MAVGFDECSRAVQRLAFALRELEKETQLLQLKPLAGREWYDLLQQKLLPQLKDDAFLVVAVVGGTNIGKSVIFNHLAGTRASSTSPLASGTKHPVCLVPPGFADRHDLDAIFDGFTLYPWKSSDAALDLVEEHRLFWRNSETTPENLLVLDTPDIDSDAPVNWHRADHIRRSADVLIAVLTQQKYNDAVVKKFFRQAATEDKAVIVVFNQCQLPDDEQYWPVWLETFTSETGVDPEFVYLAPNDRRAAEENRLPFYERHWPADDFRPETPRSLTEDLSRLHFADVKLRTLQGSITTLQNDTSGIPAYLREVSERSGEFRSAAGRLSSDSVVKIKNWPTLPNRLIVKEIRDWWKQHQEGWTKRVNGFYDSVTNVVTSPFRFARDKVKGEPDPPLEVYRHQEWEAILRAVEEMFDKLTLLAEAGSELLRPRFEKLLAGRSRSDLLELLKTQHDQVNLELQLERTVHQSMKAMEQDSPEMYKFYKQLNTISAAARPAISVTLFSLGFGPAGEAVAPAVSQALAHTMGHVVADFAGGATATVAGETAMTTVGAGSGRLQARFQKLQESFIACRVEWLAKLLKDHLLGTLPEDLKGAADVPESEAYQKVKTALQDLSQELTRQPESVT